MIRIFTLLLVLATSVSSNAQIKKGAVLLGGQLSYSMNENPFFSTTPPHPIDKSGNFTISVGKAFRENSVFGLNLSYSPSNNYDVVFNNNIATTNNTKLKRYSAGIFYRKYKKLIGDFYFFAEGRIDYIGIYQKEYLNSINIQLKNTQNGGQLSVTPGISYNIFKKLQVELLIPNILYSSFMHSSYTGNQFAISTGLQGTNLGFMGIGFHFIL